MPLDPEKDLQQAIASKTVRFLVLNELDGALRQTGSSASEVFNKDDPSLDQAVVDLASALKGQPNGDTMLEKALERANDRAKSLGGLDQVEVKHAMNVLIAFAIAGHV